LGSLWCGLPAGTARGYMNKPLPMTQPPASLAEALAQEVSRETVIRRNEPLAQRTTLRVGGLADWYIEPASEKDLAAVLKLCSERSLPVFVLGRGSNLLVRDGGVRGAVICLAQPCFSRIETAGEELRCGAGAKLKEVAASAKRNGVAGFEFLEGIPGSVGGALRMNAGAMGGAMFDLVTSVRLMNFSGQVLERSRAELAVKYRGCPTLAQQVALQAVLRGRRGERDEIQRRMKEFSQKRWTSQPAAPSAGCIFKNPASIPAGKLIDELGLKGTRVGGAMVSLEHGNFLVNDGTATARQVLELIELIRSRARTERGIELEPEVEIVGE
jgi:UDP-N-acetylenolpyruvoylglucosamine reductase